MSLPDPRFPDGLRGRAGGRESTPFDEACRMAKCQKTEPGDLFFSRRHGMASCAIVMEPDRPAAEAAQSLLIGQLALADVLETLEFSSELSLLWPFTVCLGEREVARVAVGGLAGLDDPDDLPDWLVLGIHLRISGKFVSRLGENQRRQLTALEIESVTADRTHLLQKLAQSFVRLESDWNDDGFSALLPVWERHLRAQSSGSVTRLDGNGNALIRSGEATERIALLDMIDRQTPLHLAA